jgi:cell division protein FtsW (lipid II flippase)
MENKVQKLKRTSPALHLLLLLVIGAISAAGYLAIIKASNLRGYQASMMVAARNLAYLLPLIAIFFWLVRKQKFRGELILLTAAVFLFALGMLIQFRLFADPEYGTRKADIQKAERLEKSQEIRLLNIKSAYDEEKKKFVFPNGVPDHMPERNEDKSYGLGYILTATDTYHPLIGILVLAFSFLIFKDDKWLLWIQSHAVLVGLATSAVMGLVVLLYLIFGDNGKLFGQTPWEGVKILFLISFAGILADSYRRLRQTQWGLPPFRYLIPFLIIATMPVIPFFVLHDFGQLLVFSGVYVMLYVIAVRNQAKLFYVLVLLLAIFLTFAIVSKVTTGFGIPSYVQFRFHAWVDMWNPPPPNTAWWRKFIDSHVRENYTKKNKPAPDLNDPETLEKVSREVWKDKTLQYSQGLFGVNEGGVTGEGLGLGYPETVSVSDSDFIYAAIGEETGMMGGLALILALAVFVFAGTAISIGAPDMFTKLLAAGLTSFVAFQAIVNIGGVLRLLPMTGITLPFVSHGGWSLITSFAMLGILLAFSHRNALANQAKADKEVKEEPRFLPVN